MRTPFIVAELSANHLGDFERARAIVDAAADAGADGIKFQVWEEGTMCPDKNFTLDAGPWKGKTLFELYQEAYTPWEWLPDLFERARIAGLIPFASAFDKPSVDFLEGLECPIYKIASFELVDLPLIRYVASKRKPMIISTGMASAKEIQDAIHAAAKAPTLTVLRCVSAYPSDASDAHLASMKRLWPNYGLSDHSMGIGVAVAAAVMGASVIEKHLTLKRSGGGPDAAFSMQPREFRHMVDEIHRAVAAIGRAEVPVNESEMIDLRRSIFLAKDIAAGQIITAQHLCTARPALGMSPARFEQLCGRTMAKAAKAGSPFTPDLLA